LLACALAGGQACSTGDVADRRRLLDLRRLPIDSACSTGDVAD
jgi:hypothetical protein